MLCVCNIYIFLVYIQFAFFLLFGCFCVIYIIYVYWCIFLFSLFIFFFGSGLYLVLFPLLCCYATVFVILASSAESGSFQQQHRWVSFCCSPLAPGARHAAVGRPTFRREPLAEAGRPMSFSILDAGAPPFDGMPAILRPKRRCPRRSCWEQRVGLEHHCRSCAGWGEGVSPYPRPGYCRVGRSSRHHAQDCVLPQPEGPSSEMN